MIRVAPKRGISPANRDSPRRRERTRLVRALAAVDLLAIVAAVVATGLVRTWVETVVHVAPLDAERHLIASILVPPVLLLLFRLQGLYDLDQILAGTREYGRVVNAVTYGIFIALAVSYFAGGNPVVSRAWLLFLWVLTILAVGGARFLARRVVRRLRRRGLLRTQVVIVGASTHGVAIAEQLSGARNEGLDVVGFLDEYLPIGEPLLGEIAVIGRPGDLLRADAATRADEYVLVPQALPSERLEQIGVAALGQCGPIVRVALSTTDLLTNGVLISERASVPLLRLQTARIVGVDALLKRALDVVGATIGLIVLGPPVLVALARGYLRRTRPLLTRQELRGARGDGARVWLLNPAVSESLAIRGTPALLAVLSGKLSLVGPRPVGLGDSGGGNLAGRLASTKPGLTGPWRLSGRQASRADQAARDLAYVRNYSIWEDARIILTSIGVLGSRPIRIHLARWQEGGTPHVANVPAATGDWRPASLGLLIEPTAEVADATQST